MRVTSILIKNLPKKALYSLEAGCGSGKTSLILASKGLFVILLDYCYESLKVAKKLFETHGLKERADFVLADVRYLPFKNDVFDVVFNQGVLEHFSDEEKHKVVNEMTRVAKKNGLVGISVPNAWNLCYRFAKYIAERKGFWNFGFENPISPVELSRVLERSGLLVKKHGAPTITGVLWLYYVLENLWPTRVIIKKFIGTTSELARKFSTANLVESYLRWESSKIMKIIEKISFLDKYFENEIFYLGIKMSNRQTENTKNE